MKETVIIAYVIILQFFVTVLVKGILTYGRYRKESLGHFLLIYGSLEMILIGLLLKACIVYAGKETVLMHQMIRFFDLLGTVVLLYAIPLFPVYMIGQRPGKVVRFFLTIPLAVIFAIDILMFQNNGGRIFLIINKVIAGAILFSSMFIILSSIRSFSPFSKNKAIAYLIGISIILFPFLFMKSSANNIGLFQNLWFINSFALLIFFFLTGCGGLLLIRKYFDIPSYMNPEDGQLSEYFISKYNITEREAEIIMWLQKGKAYKEIAEELSIAYKTVDAHIQNIYSKTEVNSRKQLVNLIETSSI